MSVIVENKSTKTRPLKETFDMTYLIKIISLLATFKVPGLHELILSLASQTH